MKEISFVMCVRDRDNKRIQRCINSIKKLAKEIIIIDYNSKKEVKVNGAKIIRVENKLWNKSHALNIGIKNSSYDFICTIDCDIILNDKILGELEKNINENTLIINTNVRRINTKDIVKDEKETLKKSSPWWPEGNRNNIYSSANGGIQCFSRSWFYSIGGYDEGLGLYWGGMDNRLYEQAKGTGISIIDLNMPMLHQEHKFQKNENLNEEERYFSDKCAAYKKYYLAELIKEGNFISKRPWGEKEPNHDWFIEKVKEWSKGVILDKKQNGKYVYIAIIDNSDFVPINFVLNLSKIILSATKSGINVLVRNVHAEAVDSIRNSSVLDAINNKCTHILQLDTDNLYPADIITRLLNHEKDFVCAPYNMRVSPYTYLQFKDITLSKVNKDKENSYDFISDEGLIEIGGTGAAGNLINLNVFKKIKYPYYERKITKVGNEWVTTGEDIDFCRKCKKANIKIWCDTSLSYPHQLKNHYIDKKEINSIN